MCIHRPRFFIYIAYTTILTRSLYSSPDDLHLYNLKPTPPTCTWSVPVYSLARSFGSVLPKCPQFPVLLNRRSRTSSSSRSGGS